MEETKAYLSSTGIDVSDVELDMLWNLVDVDGNGSVDTAEFRLLHFAISELRKGMKMGHVLRLLQAKQDPTVGTFPGQEKGAIVPGVSGGTTWGERKPSKRDQQVAGAKRARVSGGTTWGERKPSNRNQQVAGAKRAPRTTDRKLSEHRAAADV